MSTTSDEVEKIIGESGERVRREKFLLKQGQELAAQYGLKLRGQPCKMKDVSCGLFLWGRLLCVKIFVTPEKREFYMPNGERLRLFGDSLDKLVYPVEYQRIQDMV